VQKEPMLKETYLKLSKELERLKTVERAAIAKIIDEARALGDLKENAEYHAAKEKQGLMEARIAELSDLTSRAQIVDPSTLTHVRVCFGSTVVLTDQESQKEICYTIVGGQESSPQNGLISIQSPMVELNLPSGQKTYEIEEVFYKEIIISE
jgi:transcription elongation factor GreA